MVLNLLQTILAFTLFLWIVCLGLSFLFQRQQQYWNWTGTTLQRIFRDYWRYLACVAIGYFLATENIFRLSVNN
ncbi:MAG: hypothetical protein QG669_401 [Patescibacteria group bacterium]|nr:hypothetical protein [Patescibacteria group bacterium]